MWIVTGFIAPADCMAIAYGETAQEAIDRWAVWLTRGESMESLSDSDFQWLTEAKSDLRNIGKTKPQDSGCHYRLERLYP